MSKDRIIFLNISNKLFMHLSGSLQTNIQCKKSVICSVSLKVNNNNNNNNSN